MDFSVLALAKPLLPVADREINTTAKQQLRIAAGEVGN